VKVLESGRDDRILGSVDRQRTAFCSVDRKSFRWAFRDWREVTGGSSERGRHDGNSIAREIRVEFVFFNIEEELLNRQILAYVLKSPSKTIYSKGTEGESPTDIGIRLCERYEDHGEVGGSLRLANEYRSRRIERAGGRGGQSSWETAGAASPFQSGWTRCWRRRR